jgi:hypothetical protein
MSDSPGLAAVPPLLSASSAPADTLHCMGTPQQVDEEAILQDLISIVKIIGTADRDKFRKRYENGYDLTHDSLYNKWSEIFMKVQDAKSGHCPCYGACTCLCEGIGYCECVATITQQISPSTPNTLPSNNHSYTISTPSGDVEVDEELCGIMLMPKKSANGSKKVRRSLNPSNTCITGEVFLQALRSESERRGKELKEKEAKRKERKRKAEEKKRMALEKKEMRLKKKEEKEILKKMKKEMKYSNNTKNPKDKKVKKRKAKPTDQELATYICQKCSKE